MRHLLNTTRIFYGPFDLQQGGNGISRTPGFLDQPIDGDNFQDGNDGNDSQSQADDGISLDADDILGSLWGQGDGNDDADDNGGGSGNNQNQNQNSNTGNNQQQQTNQQPDPNDPNNPEVVARNITAQIQRLTAPEDLIPADFNPSDPAQLRGVMTRVQQNTAQGVLQIAFGIMNQALTAQREHLLGEMDSRIQGNTSEQRIRTMLEAAIPESRDATVAPIVQTLFTQARTRHTKPEDAIAATRKALAALGIKLGVAGPVGDTNQRRGRQQSNPLDSFFPGSAQQPVNRSQRQMQRDGRRGGNGG